MTHQTPNSRLPRIAATVVALFLIGATAAARADGPTPAVPAQPSARLDSALRFRNAAIVTTAPEPALLPRPAARPFMRWAYFFDAYLGQRSVRLLASDPAGRARAVNALDEVPDSSWFQNRAGVRAVSPSELRERPVAPPRLPFAVVGSKEGGVSLGMLVRDANGVRYLLKFGPPDDPDGENSTDLVLQRLLWAVGYHTAEDAIVRFRPEDLRLDAKATLKDALGVARPMTASDLARLIEPVVRRDDGTYRALVSRLLDGVPLGGYAQEGVRPDDPNDTVAHQERRELRGARIFFSWLNHVDVKEDNCLDTWIEGEGTASRGRLRHNLVDFGNALGLFAWKTDPSVGYSDMVDFSDGARALVSFGLWKRPWDGIVSSPLPGVGNLESARFDPVRWRPRYPWAPFERFDRFDGVWGARILMRVSPEDVAAAVAEGQYGDPRSAAYITKTLIERQRKIGRHYLAQTSPLESFTVSQWQGGSREPAGAERTPDAADTRMCFSDPLLAHFATEDPRLLATTRHRIATWDFDGHRLPLRAASAGGAEVCIDGITLAPDHDGYTVVDIETTREGTPRNRVLVHLARTPGTGEPRVIGIRRL